MSSSRIIKSEQVDPAAVSDFAFRPIVQGGAAVGGEPATGGFQPMGLFDTSELGGYADQQQDEPEQNEPPGVTLSEDELDRQLRESFNSGLQEGKSLADRGLANVFRSLRSATEAIHDLRDKVLRESEDEIVKLVMMVARRVILREINQDRAILAEVVKGATAALSEREEITIRLNPDDFALITTGRDEMLKQELLNDRMHLRADPSLQPGNCLIDTEMGVVDARIEAQLDEIYRRLLEEKSQNAGGA